MCIKIFRKSAKRFFLQLLDRGMNKIKKRIYFLTLSHSSFLLPSVMEFFTEIAVFLGHPCLHTSISFIPTSIFWTKLIYYLEEKLNFLKKNVYKALPNTRLESKTDSMAYNRYTSFFLENYNLLFAYFIFHLSFLFI